MCSAFKAKSLFSLCSPQPITEHVRGVRAWSFPQCRTPGHVGLQNRQSLRKDSHWSGTPPCSHGLAEMWSDLTMVWRSPAQSHSALFLPRFYPRYIFCPPTPSFQPSFPGNTLLSSLCDPPYPAGVLCLQPSLCTGISADGLHSPPCSLHSQSA